MGLLLLAIFDSYITILLLKFSFKNINVVLISFIKAILKYFNFLQISIQ